MIRVVCESCGARLRGPDKSAGKKIKCPKCGKKIPVPRPDTEPEAFFDDLPAPDDAYGTDEPALPRLAAKPPSASEDNPYAPPRSKIKKAKSKPRKEVNSDRDDLSGLDTVLCLICPGIACIASVVYMLQGKSKGIKVFGLSILGNVFWFCVRLAIESATKQPGGGP